MLCSRHFVVSQHNRSYIMLIIYLLRHKIGGYYIICRIYEYKAQSISVFNYVFPSGATCMYSHTDVTHILFVFPLNNNKRVNFKVTRYQHHPLCSKTCFFFLILSVKPCIFFNTVTRFAMGLSHVVFENIFLGFYLLWICHIRNEQAQTIDSQKGLRKKKYFSKVEHILQNIFHINSNRMESGRGQ